MRRTFSGSIKRNEKSFLGGKITGILERRVRIWGIFKFSICGMMAPFSFNNGVYIVAVKLIE